MHCAVCTRAAMARAAMADSDAPLLSVAGGREPALKTLMGCALARALACAPARAIL